MSTSAGIERTFTVSELIRGYKLWHKPEEFIKFEDYLLSQGLTDDSRVMRKSEALDLLEDFGSRPQPTHNRTPLRFGTLASHRALSHGKLDLESLEYQ